jgi:hypothetical protein
MNHFNRQYEFEKELKKLSKKFPSLEDDLKSFEKILVVEPLGIGKNFTIIHDREEVAIVKARLACRSLQGDRSLRIIYAHHRNTISFVYIELYHKGNKVNEDRDRYQAYVEAFLANS